MKTKLLLVIALACALVMGPAWAHHDVKLVIDPALPDTSQMVTISVTDSACADVADVINAGPREFQIHMRFPQFAVYQQCLEENPDAPNFETTIGPLKAGDYVVGVVVRFGGLGGNLTDVESFSVIEALPTATLSEGGINGLYHDPQAPHRYFYVLETDYTTLVVWNTFDPDGNQLWVYGVGDLLNDGQSVVAETYINRSAGFLPNGEADDSVEPWGVIRVDLSSCKAGTVTYQSDLPEFGSGQFSVRRLAYSKQIGCVDSE